MDKLSKQQRHNNMAAIRSKDTKPEMIVRRGLWKRGFRYRLNHKRLAAMGWHCITVWECELTPKKREETLESIAFTLNHIWLQDHQARVMTYPKQEEEDMQMPMAAEGEM